jgi:two-component system response regulator
MLAQNMNKLILVAEDSDDDFEAVLRALEKSGTQKSDVVRCEDGQEVLDYFQGQGRFADLDIIRKPSMILMDLNMPVKGGREVLKEIQSYREYKDVPVIILTTSLDQKDVQSCYADGAKAYIQKPLNLDGLYTAIKRTKEYWLDIAVLPQP